MTIALGMRCMDGLVLCADSLESDGVTKRMVRKLWLYEVQHQGRNEWGVAIASAGEADLADSFNDDLKQILGNSDFDEVTLLSKLRTALRTVRLTYQEASFGFLAVVYGNPTLYRKLFRVMDGSSHMGPVTAYQAIGMGGSLANYLASKLYTPTMCVEEAARLGVLILSQVKEHVEGCSGPTCLVTFGGVGVDAGRGFRTWTRDQIASVEAELSDEKFRQGLVNFWNENNALPRFPRIPSDEGGSTQWTITTKLNTKP